MATSVHFFSMKITLTRPLYLIEANCDSRKKSELLNILLQESEAEKESPVSFDVKILDGAVIVHLLSPANATTFDDYANNVFIPYVKRQLDTSRRVDVVWDVYVANSIKE